MSVSVRMHSSYARSGSMKQFGSRGVSPSVSTCSGSRASSRSVSPMPVHASPMPFQGMNQSLHSPNRSSFGTIPRANSCDSDPVNVVQPRAIRHNSETVASSSFSLPRAGGSLAQAISPGDVLFVPGTGGGLAEIGTAGGLFGHFMVVLGKPHTFAACTAEASSLEPVWLDGSQEIVQFSVLESTRGIEGLHIADLLMTVDKHTGKFILCGEIDVDGELCILENETVELWQSPPKLRTSLRLDLIRQVVAEMKLCNGSWSITTAARALFRNASSFNSLDKTELLSEIKTCWGADPICTSVVIIFWQRYLCKLASSLHASSDSADQVDLILEFMPLKADRGLPGDVLRALKECGWIMISRAPGPSNNRSRSASNLRSLRANSFGSFSTFESGSVEGKSLVMDMCDHSESSIPPEPRLIDTNWNAATPFFSDLQPRNYSRLSPMRRRHSIDEEPVLDEEPVPCTPRPTQTPKNGHLAHLANVNSNTWGPIWL